MGGWRDGWVRKDCSFMASNIFFAEEGLENSVIWIDCISTHRGTPLQEFVLNFSRDIFSTWAKSLF